MSVATEISRLTGLRNRIKTKLISLGLLSETPRGGVVIVGDDLDACTRAVENISGTRAITNTSQVDVAGYQYAEVSDQNLIAGNIKDGVTILGVTGSYSRTFVNKIASSSNSDDYMRYLSGSLQHGLGGDFLFALVERWSPSGIDVATILKAEIISSEAVPVELSGFCQNGYLIVWTINDAPSSPSVSLKQVIISGSSFVKDTSVYFGFTLTVGRGKVYQLYNWNTYTELSLVSSYKFSGNYQMYSLWEH